MTAKSTAEGTEHLKSLNEELLDHAQEKVELHNYLGHTHPSMTNSLLQDQEMEQILQDRDYRSVGGDRGESNDDKKGSKEPKGPASSPASPPTSAAADTSGPKGSSAKSDSSGPKTLGSSAAEPKESKGKKGESSGDAVTDEDNTDGDEEEELPVNEGDEPAEEEPVEEGGGEEPAAQEEDGEALNVTEVDQEEVFFGK